MGEDSFVSKQGAAEESTESRQWDRKGGQAESPVDINLERPQSQVKEGDEQSESVADGAKKLWQRVSQNLWKPGANGSESPETSESPENQTSKASLGAGQIPEPRVPGSESENKPQRAADKSRIDPETAQRKGEEAEPAGGTDSRSSQTGKVEPKYQSVKLNEKGDVEHFQDDLGNSYQLVGSNGEGSKQYVKIDPGYTREPEPFNGTISRDKSGKVTIHNEETGQRQSYSSATAAAESKGSTLYEVARTATVATTHVIAGETAAKEVDSLFKNPEKIGQWYNQAVEVANKAQAAHAAQIAARAESQKGAGEKATNVGSPPSEKTSSNKGEVDAGVKSAAAQMKSAADTATEAKPIAASKASTEGLKIGEQQSGSTLRSDKVQTELTTKISTAESQAIRVDASTIKSSGESLRSSDLRAAQSTEQSYSFSQGLRKSELGSSNSEFFHKSEKALAGFVSSVGQSGFNSSSLPFRQTEENAKSSLLTSKNTMQIADGFSKIIGSEVAERRNEVAEKTKLKDFSSVFAESLSKTIETPLKSNLGKDEDDCHRHQILTIPAVIADTKPSNIEQKPGAGNSDFSSRYLERASISNGESKASSITLALKELSIAPVGSSPTISGLNNGRIDLPQSIRESRSVHNDGTSSIFHQQKVSELKIELRSESRVDLRTDARNDLREHRTARVPGIDLPSRQLDGIRQLTGNSGRQFEPERSIKVASSGSRLDETNSIKLTGERMTLSSSKNGEGRYMIAEIALAMVIASGGIRRILPTDKAGSNCDGTKNNGIGGKNIERQLDKNFSQDTSRILPKVQTFQISQRSEKNTCSSWRADLFESTLASGKKVAIAHADNQTFVKAVGRDNAERNAKPVIEKARSAKSTFMALPATIEMMQRTQKEQLFWSASSRTGWEFSSASGPSWSTSNYGFKSPEQDSPKWARFVDSALKPIMQTADQFVEMEDPFQSLLDLFAEKQVKRSISSIDAFERVSDSGNNDDNSDRNRQNNLIMQRPTILISESDTLLTIAEEHFNDPNIAWLIADLNKGNCREHSMDGKRIVEFKSRQLITLPVWEDIVEFYQRMAEANNSDLLITIVQTTQLDREIVDSVLGPVMKRQTNGLPFRQKADARPEYSNSGSKQ